MFLRILRPKKAQRLTKPSSKEGTRKVPTLQKETLRKKARQRKEATRQKVETQWKAEKLSQLLRETPEAVVTTPATVVEVTMLLKNKPG